MNFKKILVLVMTFAMLFTVAAPALGVFAEEDNDDANLVENLKAPLEHAYNFVLENYDEAYAYAYGIVDEKGYIDIAVDAFDVALDAIDTAIDAVNTADLGADLKADVVVELEAAKATLVEVQGAIEAGNLDNVDGLVESVSDLTDDLYTHLGNAKTVLGQATADATPYVVEAIELVEAYVADELVPTLLATAEEFAYAVVDYVLTNIDDIYYSIPEVAVDVFENVLEAVVLVQVYVGNAIDATVDFVLETYNTVLDLAWELHDNRDEVIAFAQDLYIELLLYVAELDAEYDLQGKFETVFGITVGEAVELLETLANHIYDNKDVAIDAFYDILETIKEVGHAEFAKAIELYNVVLNVLEGTYGNTEDLVIVTGQIFSYVYDFVVANNTLGEIKEHCDNIVDLIAATYGDTKDIYEVGVKIYAYAVEIFNDTFTTDYELTIDSSYVALGNATYGKELAEMLHLSDKYSSFDLDDDYLDALSGADFVTVRIDNGQIIEFAVSQATNFVFGSNLDWSAHLDAEGQAALNDVLVAAEAELIRSGKAAEWAEMFNLSEEFVASVVVYALESAVYAYADLIADLETVLSDIYTAAPNATVVITGVQNPFETLGLEAYGIDLSGYSDEINAVLDVFNAQLVAVAYVNENTIYVDSDDAADIYAALNVTCAHAYDDCEDTTCNICGETRVAPGHTYGDYVSNNDAKCEVDGTKTAVCSVCGHEETVTDNGSALEHKWGEWVTVVEPTRTEEGKKEHKCELCGKVETDSITPIGGINPIVPVLIVVAAAAIAGVLYYRKKKVAPANNENK